MLKHLVLLCTTLLVGSIANSAHAADPTIKFNTLVSSKDGNTVTVVVKGDVVAGPNTKYTWVIVADDGNLARSIQAGETITTDANGKVSPPFTNTATGLTPGKTYKFTIKLFKLNDNPAVANPLASDSKDHKIAESPQNMPPTGTVTNTGSVDDLSPC